MHPNLTHIPRLAALAAVLAGTLAGVGPAAAAPIGYTDRASFQSALVALGLTQHVAGFDTTAADTLIASGGALDGIGFSYDFGGTSLKVTDAFDCPSPSNSLGTNDADETLQDGDDLTFTFLPRRAFGLSIISADTL